jgi:beta-lactamase superfamily II metal-dependent hydrolase
MNIYTTFGKEQQLTATVSQRAIIGEMNLAFIDMGQGDCTIISCPDNSVYIVDCGTTAELSDESFAEAKKLVRSWSKGKAVNVIMTHPDKDHYNKFIELLCTEPKVSVNIFYFSRALSKKSPLGYYKERAMMRNIFLFGRPILEEVTLNGKTHESKKWLPMFDYEDPITTDIPEDGYVIKKGKTRKGFNWSLTIIAGNVPTVSRSASTKSNVVSLCTLVKFDKDKLLLTGDSTDETLTYLYSKQKPNIKEVSIFQVPHHGSESSLPTESFKDWVNPESLLVSVGLLVNSFNLPRYDVMSRWLTSSRLRNVPRTYQYWQYGMEGYDSYKDLQRILDVDWKDYDWEQNDSRTFFWLKDPKDAGPKKSGTGFFGFSYKNWFLFRAESKKDLYQTGVIGSWFDEDFVPPTL